MQKQIKKLITPENILTVCKTMFLVHNVRINIIKNWRFTTSAGHTAVDTAIWAAF